MMLASLSAHGYRDHPLFTAAQNLLTSMNRRQKYILNTNPKALTCRLGAVPVSF
jgi:hypothetical protein